MWKGYSLTEKTQRTILPHVKGALRKKQLLFDRYNQSFF